MNIIIRHEKWKYQAKPEEQKFIEEIIKDALEGILLECVTYNATVEVIKTCSGNYMINAICDDYKTLMRMQSYLPTVLPNFD